MNVVFLEWAKTVFDLLKGIAWPLAILFVVWIFRHEVRSRIKDIISVGPSGAVLQPHTQSGEAKPPAGLIEMKHALPTVQALITQINEQVSELPVEERIPKLVYSLSEAQTERDFESIWGVVFGSQIAALRYLKVAGAVSIDDAKKYFEEKVIPIDRDLYSKFGFEDWSHYILGQQLVAIDDQNISLTPRGDDFLSFVDVRKTGLTRGL